MESNKTDGKKEISTFKSHDQILKLLEEIKSIEDRIKDPERIQKNLIEDNTNENITESLSSNLTPEIKEDSKIEKNKDNNYLSDSNIRQDVLNWFYKIYLSKKRRLKELRRDG